MRRLSEKREMVPIRRVTRLLPTAKPRKMRRKKLSKRARRRKKRPKKLRLRQTSPSKRLPKLRKKLPK